MRIHRLATVVMIAVLPLVAHAGGPPVAYVSMTYTSNPAGAVVVRDGAVLGRTPMTRIVKAPMQRTASGDAVAPGCLDPDPVTFKWVSGATTTVANPCETASVKAADMKKVLGAQSRYYTASVQVSASRPEEAPGLVRDQRTARALGSSSGFLSPATGRGAGWRSGMSRAASFGSISRDGDGSWLPLF
jgi:hypothetical protein